jgi:hypothetical protein
MEAKVCEMKALVLDRIEWPASHSGQLYPWGKKPQYPMDRDLGDYQNQSGHDEIILASARKRIPVTHSKDDHFSVVNVVML